MAEGVLVAHEHKFADRGEVEFHLERVHGWRIHEAVATGWRNPDTSELLAIHRELHRL